MNPRYPSLYQINTRVYLTRLSRALKRAVTLDDIPDRDLDEIATMGFDWVWFLSVWQTGEASRQVSRTQPDWRREFEETLPDLREEDICGSGFAITGYTVHESLGGNAALARLRKRMRKRGLKLLLDFVPNHMALDHPWMEERPEYFVKGTEADLARAPQNYCWVKSGDGPRLLAHGRDPFFPGWPDTLQLNYANPALQEAMVGELLRIAELCDGVRCDMAMLILPDVFERTWGARPEPFWPQATERVRARQPGFVFMAEVYWDLEWTLQQQGFNYTYDKRLYDRLRERHVRPVRDHLRAGLDFQDRLVRFLENHDEPRAAATFPSGMHQAAAVVTFFTPGLRFFHQGQFEGMRKRISPHLGRGPEEPLTVELRDFYGRLLSCLDHPTFKSGEWRQLDCVPGWDGNWTCENFLAYAWQGEGGRLRLVTVNYAPDRGQCHVRLPFDALRSGKFRLKDLMSEASYDWRGDDLLSRGLYLDIPEWGYHVFDVISLP